MCLTRTRWTCSRRSCPTWRRRISTWSRCGSSGCAMSDEYADRGFVAEGQQDFARCVEHGLHGQRKRCYECGEEAEQVPFVPREIYMRDVFDTARAVVEQRQDFGRLLAEVVEA